MIQVATDSGRARRLRQLLATMVLLLTFEGIARKAAPGGLGVPIFLLKDCLTVWMAVYVVRMQMNPMLKPLWSAYIAVSVLMIPLVILTATHDPLLAVFGAKQYLLFPMVAFATFLAFERARIEIILTFFRWTSLLLIPTVLLAIVQIKLPHNSWLNMSVRGESLEGFSAEGQLRVSSTFSFVAQFCAFLNAQIYIIFIALQGWGKQSARWKMLLVVLMPLILVGSFITGSRSAVAANLAIILVALVLSMLKFRAVIVFRLLFIIVSLYLGVLAINHFFPSVTIVYSAREQSHLIGFSSEIRDRVFGAFTNFSSDPSMRTFFGNGLGVMSNGVENISYYAAKWRYRLWWTETDFGTIIFEGGAYLAIVWYGLRLFVILYTLAHFLMDISAEFSVPMAFCQGFVIVLGLFGTLSIQPPIAIWWWMGVGTSLLFSWKSIAPPESEEPPEDLTPPPRRKIRGRSLYADVIHSKK